MQSIRLNGGWCLRRKLNLILFVSDGQAGTCAQGISSMRSAGIDFEHLHLEDELKPQTFESRWYSWQVRDLKGKVPLAVESVDVDFPHPALRRFVASIFDVS